MNEDYDVIVLGTGLKECILSGLMTSVERKRVLHVDRNSYYGGESASLNLEQLYAKFAGGKEAPKDWGRNVDWSVDLCPKFLMACGVLVKILVRTKVTAYLDFKSVNGSYVVKKDKPHKVPSNAKEALQSSLMGMFQKRYFRNFIQWANNYDDADPATHNNINIDKATAQEVFKKFNLDENTILFTGHALALHMNDDYLQQPIRATLDKIKLYGHSVSRYGNSPYIYPVYGLGGLAESFARLTAVYNGVYMLNKPVDKLLFDDNGRITGIESGGEVARCKQLIADPSYFREQCPEKIKLVGEIVRCVCILNHPIDGTGNSDSAQFILPGAFCGRKSDMYMTLVSFVHEVAHKGYYIAAISCRKETDNPLAELTPALKLLGKIEARFFWVQPQYHAVNDPEVDGCYIPNSFDPTTHFESATIEVLEMYKKLTGKALDLDAPAEERNVMEEDYSSAAAAEQQQQQAEVEDLSAQLDDASIEDAEPVEE